MNNATTTTTENTNTNTNTTTANDAPSSFDSRLRAHFLAVQQATRTIQNSYRFIQEMAPREDVSRLCAVVHDHIERITAEENVPPQMVAYEMALESAREFMIIPDGATPLEIVDILKTTLEPTKLMRSFAVDPELCVQLPSLTPSHVFMHELTPSYPLTPTCARMLPPTLARPLIRSHTLIPGYNYESPENMHTLICDQDYSSLGPTKLFSDDESEDGDEV